MALTRTGAGNSTIILSNGQAAAALRLATDASQDPPEPLNGIIDRLLNVADTLINRRTTDALPEPIRIEAVLALVQFMYDQPLGNRSNAMIRSGVYEMIRPYMKRRTGII